MQKRSRGAAPPPPSDGHGAIEHQPDEALVDRAVDHLRKLVVVGQVETYGGVGEYLIEDFYGGVEHARSRNPRKAASLRRLAERAPEFGMTPATMAQSVRLALVVRDVGKPLSGRLGVTRLRALAPVKDDTQRRLLAETAASSGWTVDKLQKRVRQLAKPHPGGRPERAGIDNAVGRIGRLVAAEATTAQLRAGLDSVGARRAKQLLATVNRAQADLERIEKMLQRLVGK